MKNSATTRHELKFGCSSFKVEVERGLNSRLAVSRHLALTPFGMLLQCSMVIPYGTRNDQSYMDVLL
jgi:hypothetical protein